VGGGRGGGVEYWSLHFVIYLIKSLINELHFHEGLNPNSISNEIFDLRDKLTQTLLITVFVGSL
jgi:hypothetical protein